MPDVSATSPYLWDQASIQDVDGHGTVLVVPRRDGGKTRRCTSAYIDAALEACAKLERADTRLAEWQQLRKCYDRVVAGKPAVPAKPKPVVLAKPSPEPAPKRKAKRKRKTGKD